MTTVGDEAPAVSSRGFTYDHAMSTIDRDRARITARSILVNLGILADEGLALDRQARAIEHAEILAVAPFARAACRPDAFGHATALRDLLATLTGPTAAVLVAWLDDALRGE
jgi:hypothetical protein